MQSYHKISNYLITASRACTSTCSLQQFLTCGSGPDPEKLDFFNATLAPTIPSPDLPGNASDGGTSEANNASPSSASYKPLPHMNSPRDSLAAMIALIMGIALLIL